MHAHAPQAFTPANPYDVLLVRAQVRAYLFVRGEYADIHEVVDPLQEYAEASGLVAAIGQDHVQFILANAFAEAEG